MSRASPAFGGGIAVGSEDRVSLGARAVYFTDLEAIHSLEISVFLRFYILCAFAPGGLFAQINTGAVIFAREKAVALPSDAGSFLACLAAGWCFLLGSTERFYIEPVIRTGYPYYIGGRVSSGVRF